MSKLKVTPAERPNLAPTSPKVSSVATALRFIGTNAELRDRFVALLRDAEDVIKLPPLRSVREEVTGPIMDELFAASGPLTKQLADNVLYQFLYRSKIARDLLLTRTAQPDHVFEPQTTKLLLHLCRGRKTVVIGGAYGGDHVLFAAKAVAPSGGTVYAFEPNGEQMAVLRQNAENNGVANIVANELGLWRGQTVLEVVGTDAYAHAVEAGPGTASDAETFRATSLDAYGPPAGLTSIDVIMLDVEGAELPIFEGARTFLSQPRGTAPDLIYELHRHYVDWSYGLANTEIVRFLKSFGYTSFAVRDFQSNVDMRGCKIELVPLEKAVLEGPPHGFNMIAVKDLSVVRTENFRVVEGVSPKLLVHKEPLIHHPTEWLKS